MKQSDVTYTATVLLTY